MGNKETRKALLLRAFTAKQVMGIESFLKSRKPSKIGGLRLLHPSEHTLEHSLGDGKTRFGFINQSADLFYFFLKP